MRKTREDSRIEVWGEDYVNFPGRRQGKDASATIVQIEPGGDPAQYMVEVVDRE